MTTLLPEILAHIVDLTDSLTRHILTRTTKLLEQLVRNPSSAQIVCERSAKRGYLNILKWAHENNYPWDEETCNNAAYSNNLDMLMYCHESGCPWDEETCAIAASEGYLEILQYAHKNGCPWEYKGCSEAIENGHLPIIKYAFRKGFRGDEHMCSVAAREGYLHILKYLRANKCPWNSNVCYWASVGGHLDILVYARENTHHGIHDRRNERELRSRIPWDACPWDIHKCFRGAARQGHLNILKYIHESGYILDEFSIIDIVVGGNLNAAKWAYETQASLDTRGEANCVRAPFRMHGCSWNERICSEAARGGRLEILRYLIANGCPWDERTCSAAARGGHLEILQYCHENGCPWDENTCYNAVQYRYLDILVYARENGCPWDRDGCLAVARKWPEIEQWIVRHA